MTKLDNVNICINKIFNNRVERHMKEVINKIEKECKEINIEKIAFSLFCTYYFNNKFMFEKDDYLIDLEIKRLKEIWKLGKLKNKLQSFFNLAEKFYEVNFDK